MKERKTKLIKLMVTPSKYAELKAKAAERELTLKQYILRTYISEK